MVYVASQKYGQPPKSTTVTGMGGTATLLDKHTHTTIKNAAATPAAPSKAALKFFNCPITKIE